MRINIRHVTRYAYAPAAPWVAMRLRLFPSVFATQTLESWEVSVNGAVIAPSFDDAAMNAEGFRAVEGPVEAVEVIAEGTILRGDDAGVLKGMKDRTPTGLYLRQTELTSPNDAICQLAEDAKKQDPLETLHALCSAVRDAIDYVPETTTPATSAGEALAQAKGVCQDHTHVFITAARCLGIPARYVAGYYFADPAADQDAVYETHAWAEGHVPGLGWVGFDVANRTCSTRQHVRVSSDLDAQNASLITGSVMGQPTETMTVAVAMSQAQQ
ncbi:MAG: transglutaminase domain-containing protein [Pseudomonadota bacterium]